METLRQLSEPKNFAEQALLHKQVAASLRYLNTTLTSTPAQLQPCAGLIAQLAELTHNSNLSLESASATQVVPLTKSASVTKPTVSIQTALRTRLSEAIADWQSIPQVSVTEMAYPLLVHSMLTNQPAYERKAQRILNRAYKTLLTTVNQINIPALYAVTTLKTYVTRYSRNKINTLLSTANSLPLTPDDYLKLHLLTTQYTLPYR